MKQTAAIDSRLEDEEWMGFWSRHVVVRVEAVSSLVTLRQFSFEFIDSFKTL